MSRDKQIEEMAKQLYGNFGLTMPTARNVAKYLTEKKGYRKASDVAREIFEDCHNTLIKILNTVRDGLDKAIREGNEEAKNVHIGTEETVKCIILIFAELKKKYTQEK